MKQIVQDFKLPEVPDAHDLGKDLNNIAFGEIVSTNSKLN